jgi:hypothetical protein
MPVAGRSLRPSRASLARCFLRFAILAARRKQRRLPGKGSPSLPTVAQVFNLCASRMHRFSTCVHLGFASRSGLSSGPLKSSGAILSL